MEKKVNESVLFAARDKNGELYFYTEKPKMREDGTFIASSPLSDRQFMPFIGKGQFRECVITVKG